MARHVLCREGLSTREGLDEGSIGLPVSLKLARTERGPLHLIFVYCSRHGRSQRNQRAELLLFEA